MSPKAALTLAQALGKSEKPMTLDQAIQIVKKAVKFSGTIQQKHIDLTVIPSEERPVYQKALAVLQLEISKGTVTRDVLNSRLNLDH